MKYNGIYWNLLKKNWRHLLTYTNILNVGKQTNKNNSKYKL